MFNFTPDRSQYPEPGPDGKLAGIISRKDIIAVIS